MINKIIKNIKDNYVLFIIILIYILLLMIAIPAQKQVEEEECVKFYLKYKYITKQCEKYNINEQYKGE